MIGRKSIALVMLLLASLTLAACWSINVDSRIANSGTSNATSGSSYPSSGSSYTDPEYSYSYPESSYAATEGYYVSGKMLHAGGTAYFVYRDYYQMFIRIFMIDDKEDAIPKELCRIQCSDDEYVHVELIAVQNRTLYFYETLSKIGDEQTVGGVESLCLKSLDLKNIESEPVIIELYLNPEAPTPEVLTERYQNKDYSLSFDVLLNLFVSCVVEKNYVYTFFATGINYTLNETLLFQLDYTSGKVTCTEGAALMSEVRWYIFDVKDGYIYFGRYEFDSNTQSMKNAYCRADITDLKEEILVESGESKVLMWGKVINNSLFYFLEDRTNKEEQAKFCCLNLATKKETVLSTTLMSPDSTYGVPGAVGDTFYYFDKRSLRCFNLDGSNDRILIKSSDYSERYLLIVTDHWIYYTQDNRLYRVRPDATSFPTESLIMPS